MALQAKETEKGIQVRMLWKSLTKNGRTRQEGWENSRSCPRLGKEQNLRPLLLHGIGLGFATAVSQCWEL